MLTDHHLDTLAAAYRLRRFAEQGITFRQWLVVLGHLEAEPSRGRRVVALTPAMEVPWNPES